MLLCTFCNSFILCFFIQPMYYFQVIFYLCIKLKTMFLKASVICVNHIYVISELSMLHRHPPEQVLRQWCYEEIIYSLLKKLGCKYLHLKVSYSGFIYYSIATGFNKRGVTSQFSRRNYQSRSLLAFSLNQNAGLAKIS